MPSASVTSVLVEPSLVSFDLAYPIGYLLSILLDNPSLSLEVRLFIQKILLLISPPGYTDTCPTGQQYWFAGWLGAD